MILSKVRIDFIIAGYPKCGTSTLSHILSCHPQCLQNSISHTPSKEIHYYPGQLHFATKEIEDWNWYHSHWSWDERNVLRYEKTPAYAFNLHGISMLKEYREKFNNNLKIILIIRNPVNAFISRFAMYARSGDTDYQVQLSDWSDYEKKLEDFIERKEIFTDYKELIQTLPISSHPLIKQHVYSYVFALSIKELLKIFPRKNLLILSQELLKKERIEIVKSIYNYLQIEAVTTASVEDKNIAPREQIFDLPSSFLEHLKNFYRPYNKMLNELIGFSE